MKKTVIVLSALALVFGAACSTQPAEGNAQQTENRKTGRKLRSESDSVSYAVGIDLGNHLKNNIEKNLGKDYNQDVIFAGIKDVFAERPTLTMEQSYELLNEYFTVRIPAKRQAEGEKFLADVMKKNPAVQKTESGLMYEIIIPGNDNKPTSLKDNVKVMYRGTLKDGTEFDSSYERGDVAEFALNSVIKGWGEGLQLIGEGGKIKLWIPADLAYGQYGGGPLIGPNEPLVFEVELIEVMHADE